MNCIMANRVNNYLLAESVHAIKCRLIHDLKNVEKLDRILFSKVYSIVLVVIIHVVPSQPEYLILKSPEQLTRYTKIPSYYNQHYIWRVSEVDVILGVMWIAGS